MNHLQEIADALKVSQRIVIVSHFNPDADAYGSSLALTVALREQGKTVFCVNESGLSESFKFLPESETINTAFPPQERDLLIVCDCGDKFRVGDSLVDILPEFKQVIAIDHHISNQGFGTFSYIRYDATSTSELVFDLLERMEHPLSTDSALCIYCGISGDTGSFRYNTTTARTFEICSKLVRAGVSPSAAAEALYSGKSVAMVLLQSEALSQLKTLSGGKIIQVLVSEELYRKHGAPDDAAEGLVEQALKIAGAEVAFVVREQDGLFKVSLRGKDGPLDLSAVAQKFGGGGHRLAAGFRFRKSLAELLAKLTPELEQAIALTQR